MKRLLTLEDLQAFLKYVELHKDEFDEFNVIQVQTVLGSFMKFVESKVRTHKESK